MTTYRLTLDRDPLAPATIAGASVALVQTDVVPVGPPGPPGPQGPPGPEGGSGPGSALDAHINDPAPHEAARSGLDFAQLYLVGRL